MKLDREPEIKGIPAYLNTFSKVGKLEVPDSPPPEKIAEEEADINKPSKFEHLMQAACSIKQT
jgi:hypothetical protein